MTIHGETFKTLSKEVYQALEDIVGPTNISEEPAILDSYAFQYAAELYNNGSRFQCRPAAVILPGSTEEVQAIVRMCNRYKVKYKAYSTGWGTWGGPLVEGTIQLDMRRMDHILEIDEQNMFAVIEPYVVGATLQAEAMKVGLNTHMIGAGSVSSPLASATSMGGQGPSGISMGHTSENLLALEWVMPTGDILRTGSLGSGAGWFCGEGPGPSTRSVVRGAAGAQGAMGVFTKCAMKLYPWPGPPVLPVEGTVPAYNSPLPKNIRAYTLAFPTWQSYAEAAYRIFDSEIGYIAHRQFNKLGDELGNAFFMMYIDPSKTLDDFEEFLNRPEIQKLTEEAKISFQMVLAGNTNRDIEYQEKVLDQILAETGGWKVAAMSDPAMEKFTLLYLIRLCFKNLNFVYVGGYHGSFAQQGTPDFLISSYIEPAKELMRKHQETGLLVDCGPDAMMGPLSHFGYGHSCGFEQFAFYDPHDKESVKEMVEYGEEARKLARELGIPAGLESVLSTGQHTREELQSILSNAAQPAVFDWQRKIKRALDPNDTGDTNYLWREEESTN